MRTLVLHPVLAKIAPVARTGRRARGGGEPCAGARSRRGRRADRAGAAAARGHAVRQRQGRGDRRGGRRGGGRARDHRRAAVAGAAAQPRTRLEGQGARPHRADPRDLRRAGADARGRAAGRAGASELPEVAAGAVLDPPRAPAWRLRVSRRPRRDADRGGPPRARRADRPHQGGAGQGGAHPRAASRGAQARRTIRRWRWSATPTPASRRCSTG